MTFNKRKKTQSDNAGFFLLIALFFLFVSIYQNAEGYKSMTGYGTALAISIGMGLLMFLLIVEMRKKRISGQSTIWLVVGYSFLGAIFFAGNFNALYSNYNRGELLKKELIKHKDELTSITTSAINALNDADKGSTNLESKVQQLTQQLIAQISTPADPGLGTRALAIIVSLEGLLDQKLTTFSGTPAAIAKSYEDNIASILKIKLSSSTKSKAEDLILKFQKQKDSMDIVILNALKPQNISQKGQDAIFSTIDIHNNIGETSKSFTKNKFEFVRAEFENQELGKIDHSFKSAFKSENLVAGFFCALFAFLFDFGVPIVLHLFTKGQNNIEEDRNPDGITVL